MGTVAINCIFPDERVAKISVSPTDSTAKAIAYVYFNEDILSRAEFKLTDRFASINLLIQSGLTISVKVVGYNKFMTITYQGKSDKIKVVHNTTVTADIFMDKYGFVEIPAGSYNMGSGSGEKNEQPVHTVTLDSFIMSATEVTAAQWEEIMLEETYKYDDSRPISYITLEDMVNFCNQLSLKSGYNPCYTGNNPCLNDTTYVCDFSQNGYRLPTEAEWEYACRAGSSTLLNTGSNETDLAEAAWYSGNSYNYDMPVGEKKPNRWGLYDMHGNISEMCNDEYKDDYYDSSPMSNPKGPVELHKVFVVRRGHYSSSPHECRSLYRGSMETCRNFKYTKKINVGFRVVRRP